MALCAVGNPRRSVIAHLRLPNCERYSTDAHPVRVSIREQRLLRLPLRLVLVRELTPQDLADERFRQLASELDHVRDLVAGELSAAVRDELLGRRSLARLQHHE